ncbi:unnamed protein product [Brugia timori]|uniref:7TM_GPCR_Srx domain-containing protein n=1 Tax=Brugia timori TaxID=42155 RepID=A0A0R3R5W6_9BILA|nr:unnamed protein product [Brugia timori]
MACFDFTTLIKILAYQRRIRANTTISTSEAVRARGILFFRQVTKLSDRFSVLSSRIASNTNKQMPMLCNTFKLLSLQSCILGVIYISYTFILIIHPFVFTNKWVLFVSTTISWILVQSLDGQKVTLRSSALICQPHMTIQ